MQYLIAKKKKGTFSSSKANRGFTVDPRKGRQAHTYTRVRH